MTAIDKVVERAEALFRDLEFSSVRAWKERTGGLAVGYLPIYVPTELLHSQGVLPVGIVGGDDRHRQTLVPHQIAVFLPAGGVDQVAVDGLGHQVPRLLEAHG